MYEPARWVSPVISSIEGPMCDTALHWLAYQCALLVYDSGGIVVHIWHLASLGVSNAKIKPSHS